MVYAAYIHWDMEPVLIRLGPVTLRWYGVLFVVAFLSGLVLMHWIYRREGRPEKDVEKLFYYLLFGTMIGARLGHCLLYDPRFFLTHPLEILKIWKGGLASHGAAAGILFATYLLARKRPHTPFLWVLDRLVIPVMLAGCFIRLGNLFNSEIIGTPAQVPWAFVFARVDPNPRHPAQLYELAAYGVIFFLLLYLYLRGKNKRGFLLGTFLVAVFSARFLIEFCKERQAAFGADLPLSMGQWLSLPLVALGLFLLLRREPEI